MKAVEQHQPNSMDSNDSANVGSEYAYRPLTTKHRRAGSTGTTGDEEYTTDEDELYADETDCSGPSLHPPHPILKSDLVRAATDLFGYAAKPEDNAEEPTSLFDEDDTEFNRGSTIKEPSSFVYNENVLARDTLRQQRTHEETTNLVCLYDSQNDPKCQKDEPGACPLKSSCTRPADLKLKAVAITTDEESMETHESPTSSSTSSTNQQLIKSEVESQAKQRLSSQRIFNDSPPSPTTLQWGRAVAEVKEHAVAKLQEELKRAHEELKLKDEEVARLSRIRQDVETELEDLTASLFQEAHNMVREANVRQATAERLLAESRMKSEVLAAEVAALKTLVLTSTPARPNPHLHPQIDTRGRGGSAGASGGGEEGHQSLFAKKHRRSPSHFNLKYGRENSPPDSPVKEQRSSLPSEKDAFDKDKEREREREREWERERERERESRESGLEVDPRVHTEFLRWKANPCIDKTDPFIDRMYREDIDLCLDFANKELGAKVRQAVLDGIIFIEAVNDKTKLAFPKKCALLEAPRQCHYRMRLGDQENQWHCISQICRNRIIAVCDFLNYLRYIERGLVKSSVHDIYWEITRLRKEMVLARLGLALSS